MPFSQTQLSDAATCSTIFLLLFCKCIHLSSVRLTMFQIARAATFAQSTVFFTLHISFIACFVSLYWKKKLCLGKHPNIWHFVPEIKCFYVSSFSFLCLLDTNAGGFLLFLFNFGHRVSFYRISVSQSIVRFMRDNFIANCLRLKDNRMQPKCYFFLIEICFFFFFAKPKLKVDCRKTFTRLFLALFCISIQNSNRICSYKITLRSILG